MKTRSLSRFAFAPVRLSFRLSVGGGVPDAPAAFPPSPVSRYTTTSFTNFSPRANARAFSIVVMAMLCSAVRVKNA